MTDTKTTDIANLLAEMLASAVGGNHAHWLELIGPVDCLPPPNNVKSNWRISPIATGEELRAINAATEVLRAEYPYVVQ